MALFIVLDKVALTFGSVVEMDSLSFNKNSCIHTFTKGRISIKCSSEKLLQFILELLKVVLINFFFHFSEAANKICSYIDPRQRLRF